MSNFADVLKTQIVEQKQTRRAKKLLDIIDGPKGRRRDRILARLEDHARVHLKAQGVEVGEDWTAVKQRDWASFFQGLLKFLMAIFPFILPLL